MQGFLKSKIFVITSIVLITLLIAAGVIVTILKQPATKLIDQIIGIDKWEHHRTFAGSKNISQSFKPASETLAGVSVLVVDFKRQASRAPITFNLNEQKTGENIRQVIVDGHQIADDYYVPFMFEPVDVQDKTFEFTLSSPEENILTPYAVRLTEDGNLVPSGYFKEGNKAYPNIDIAFGYFASTTKGVLFKQWLSKNHSSVAQLVWATLFLSAIVFTTILINRYHLSSNQAALVLLVLVVLAGTIIQLKTIPYLKGAVGGDAYGYLLVADQIRNGINPLSLDTFRLPGYPLLLLPAMSPLIPDLLWGRLVGVISTIGIAFSLWILQRKKQLHPAIPALTMGLLYINRDFLITSLRPRPYITIAFLLILVVSLFFYIRKTKHIFWWSILLGFTAMVRQETFLPITLLGIALLISLLTRRLPIKTIIFRLIAAGLPLIIIISPYFYYNNQHYDSPFGSPYLSNNNIDLKRPHSVSDFINYNLTQANIALSSAWSFYAEHPQGLALDKDLIIIFFIIAGIYIVVHIPTTQRHRSYFLNKQYFTALLFFILNLSFISALSSIIFYGPKDLDFFNKILAVALVIGTIEMLRKIRWSGLLILLILITQLAIATWFQPFPKHYMQSFPFMALIMAIGLTSILSFTPGLTSGVRQRKLSILQINFLAAAIIIVGIVSINRLDLKIDSHNYPAAPFYANVGAAEDMEKYQGQAASEIDTTNHNGIYLFHTYQQHKLTEYELDLNVHQQLNWLCEKNIMYLMDNNFLELFTVHIDEQYKEHFQPLFSRKTIGRNDTEYRTDVYVFDKQSACY